MNRSTARLLIAIALISYGIYRSLYVPGMLVGPQVPLLLWIGFLLQAVLGVVAGIGVWRGAPWAPLAIVLLGAGTAATALVEGFVLGVIAYLSALLEALVAILVSLLLAAHVRGGPGESGSPRG